MFVAMPPTVSNTTAGEIWTIVPTRNVVLKSVALKRNICLQIGLPPDYQAGNKPCGVLFCLDAFAFGGAFRETAGLLRFGSEIPDVITVGIDLEVKSSEQWQKERAFILTPTKSSDFEEHGVPSSGTGGAPQFLKSLADEIIPFIDKNYRTIAGERTLIGHSFGGLFVAYALVKSTGLFNRYLISSPTLSWDDRVIFKLESKYAKANKDLPARVFLSAGALEHAPDDTTVPDVLRLADVLRSRKFTGLKLTGIVFENENHYSVPSIAFSRGLRVLYAKTKTGS